MVDVYFLEFREIENPQIDTKIDVQGWEDPVRDLI